MSSSHANIRRTCCVHVAHWIAARRQAASCADESHHRETLPRKARHNSQCRWLINSAADDANLINDVVTADTLIEI